MGLMALGLASQVPSPVLPSDVYISVKTSGLFHNSRLPVLLSTWLPEAGHSAHLFTDAPPSTSLANSLKKTGAESGGHLLPPTLPPSPSSVEM